MKIAMVKNEKTAPKNLNEQEKGQSKSEEHDAFQRVNPLPLQFFF